MQLKFDRASENPKCNQIKERVVGNVLARNQRPGCDLYLVVNVILWSLSVGHTLLHPTL
jgi:hypothetical protein